MRNIARGMGWIARSEDHPDSAPGNPPRDRPSPGVPPARTPFDAPASYIIVDQHGRSVTNGRGRQVGDLISNDLLAHGTPINVQGTQVGTVVITSATADLDAQEQAFLANTNRILIAAMVGGGLSALMICIVLTQFLTRPMRALTAAIRAMERGTLRQELRVTARDELGELVHAFNQLSAGLARATQLRRQITADIAHELRTPLSLLLGYIETMRDGLLPPSQDRFQTMFIEANQLQRLIDDLRLLSLADAGELSLYPQSTDPDALLRTVATSFAQQAEQQHVTMNVQSTTGLPKLLVDQGRLIQVLGNLVSNALRYTPAGGVITVSAACLEGPVRLEGRDTGCGIAPELLPSIFERLYRADPSRAAAGGSGLGLAIARAIIEAHGGTIAAESTLGMGTQISIRIPFTTSCDSLYNRRGCCLNLAMSACG
jgi:two-component system, OmpR family, sensor histidine kinase BaeS